LELTVKHIRTVDKLKKNAILQSSYRVATMPNKELLSLYMVFV